MASECGYLRGIEAALREVREELTQAAQDDLRALAADHDPATCRECKVLAAAERYVDQDWSDWGAKKNAESRLIRAVREGRS